MNMRVSKSYLSRHGFRRPQTWRKLLSWKIASFEGWVGVSQGPLATFCKGITWQLNFNFVFASYGHCSLRNPGVAIQLWAYNQMSWHVQCKQCCHRHKNHNSNCDVKMDYRLLRRVKCVATEVWPVNTVRLLRRISVIPTIFCICIAFVGNFNGAQLKTKTLVRTQNTTLLHWFCNKNDFFVHIILQCNFEKIFVNHSRKDLLESTIMYQYSEKNVLCVFENIWKKCSLTSCKLHCRQWFGKMFLFSFLSGSLKTTFRFMQAKKTFWLLKYVTYSRLVV